jgi:hypothetical protein
VIRKTKNQKPSCCIFKGRVPVPLQKSCLNKDVGEYKGPKINLEHGGTACRIL